MKRGYDAGRRRFLQIIGTTTGALVVGLPAAAWTPGQLLGQHLVQLNPYVRIEPDGTTVIGTRDPEVGQGIRTAEARILAEELDADWNRVIAAPLDLGVTSVDGEPHWIYGHQMAWGSNSVPAAWNDLRTVGAAAHYLLVRAAAARWNVPLASVVTSRGMVYSHDGRNKLSYGELAEAAAQLKPLPNPPPVKSPSAYTLVGQDAGDVDARDIVTGRQHFALDDWFGDTLVAVIARCPYPRGKLAHLNDSAALKIDGVEKVMTIPPPSPARAPGTQQLVPGVAVLAKDTWSALRGAAALAIKWQPVALAQDDDQLAQTAATTLAGTATKTVRSDGDYAATLKRARHHFKAQYQFATVAHAELEPPNALVNIDSQHATVIAPVQNPRATFATVQQLTGLDPEQIQIQLPRAGGGFGRFLETDYIAEAVLLAKAAGKPLKLMWTRSDAFAHDLYRPFSVHQLEACADAKRTLTGWSHAIASTSRLAGREPRPRWWLSEMHPDDLPAGLVANLQYNWFALDSVLPRGSYRASSHAANAFATECFIDEIAHTLKQDSLKFRLALLGAPRKLPYRGHGGPVLDTGRLAWVLSLAADAIGWSKPHPHGHGYGLACHFTFGGYVAHAVELSMENSRLVIHNVVCAADLGRVVNPLGMRAALVGATLDAFSIALRQRISVKDGRIVQRGFKDYPLAKMADMPHAVQVILVPSTEAPAGAFAMGFPSAAPALANAIFAGTTVRVRQLPIWPELMRML